MKLQHLEGDSNTQMSMIDAKTRQLIDDLKTNLTTMQTAFETEREQTEQRLLVAIEKIEGNNDLSLVRLCLAVTLRSYVEISCIHCH